MDFFEIGSRHGRVEGEDGRESMRSRVCPRTTLEGQRGGIVRLPPCTKRSAWN
jgi:hypothetical protein